MQVKDNDYAVSVLVIDDEELAREVSEKLLRNQFQKVESSQLNIKEAGTIDEALSLLASQTFHVVLLDRDMKEERGTVKDGISYIPDIKNLQPLAQVIVLTGHDDTAFAVEAIKFGACGYLIKDNSPKYREYREVQIYQALKKAKSEITQMRRRLLSKSVPSNYVCHSPAMVQVDIQLKNLAEFSHPVIFLGETGVGKTVSAKRLNVLRSEYLGQKNRPFISVNSATISSNLAESILFGHEKGAFTGANATKQGLFEQARGGDLFLDEIGNASLDVQIKLLKVVEEGKFRRVHGNTDLQTNARILFATNKNLKEMVEKKTFSVDLYARIAALTVQLPPLRDRKKDIPDICRSLIQVITKETSRKPKFEDFPDDLQEYLCRDNISYNIRGLQFDLYKLIVMSPLDASGRLNFNVWKSTLGITRRLYTKKVESIDCLTYAHLNELPTQLLSDTFPGLKQAHILLEKRILEEAKHVYKKTSIMARVLGLSQSNLAHKMRRHFSKEQTGET